MKGFRECGYIEYDNDTSVLHSRLKDSIDKRAVPENVITEVDLLLKEMMQEKENEVSIDEEVLGQDDIDNDFDYEDEDESEDESEDEEIDIM